MSIEFGNFAQLNIKNYNSKLSTVHLLFLIMEVGDCENKSVSY